MAATQNKSGELGTVAHTPVEAIANNGRPYGYWCCKRRHVWNRAEDAEKCCHPNWCRALDVRPGLSFGVDVLLSRYWLERESP